MFTALLLLKARPNGSGGRSPFRADRFEYVVASDELALLRLSGQWRLRDLAPHAGLILEAMTGQQRLTFAPLPDSVDTDQAGRRALGWRASFSIPLDLVENPATTFRLRAERLEVVLPRPVERGADSQPALEAEAPRAARARSGDSAADEARAAVVEREMRVEARRALGDARAELESLRAEAERRRDECSALESRIAKDEKALALARAENTRGTRRYETVRGRIAELGETLDAVQAERDADRSRAEALAQRLDRFEAEARSRRIRVGESRRRIVKLRDALADRARAPGADTDANEPHDEQVAELQGALEAARAESALERQRAATLAGQLIEVAEAPSSTDRRSSRRGFDLRRPLSAADRRAREVARAERRLAEIKDAIDRSLERHPASR